MSALVLSLLGGTRHISQSVDRLGVPRLWNRLESHLKVSTLNYRNSASAARPNAAAQELEVKDEEMPRFFEGTELRHYRAILEKLPAYKSTMFSGDDIKSALQEVSPGTPSPGETDWKKVPKQDFLEAFRSMAAYARRNKLSVNDSICNELANNGLLETLSPDELLEIGKVTRNLYPPNARLCTLLNHAWVSKYPEWIKAKDFLNILKAADLSFLLSQKKEQQLYLRLSVFQTAMFVKEPHHLIQLMFYMGLLKPLPNNFKVYEVEKKIYLNRKHYSVEELLVFVHAMFRAEKLLQYNPLQQHVLFEVLKNFPSLNDFSLVTVSKGFKITHPCVKPLILALQQKVMSRINDFNLNTIIHVLWMCSVNSAIDENFGQAVYERAIKEIGTIRWKDLSRLVIVFAEIPSPKRDVKHFAELVLEQMESNGDVKAWIGSKIYIQGAVLHRLLLCGAYRRGTLDAYLNWINSQSSKNRAIISKEALGIDVHLEVFYPEYEGVRLNPALREEIWQERFGSKSGLFRKSNGSVGSRAEFNSNISKQMHSDVLSIVGSVEDHIHLKQLVPSFGYLDYVLCLSKDGTYLPIPTKLKECEPWKLPYIPKEDLADDKKFIAITFFGNQGEFFNKKITNFQKEKRKILEKLGYVHVEVAVNNWVRGTPATRQRLKDIIAKRLSELET